MSDWIITAAIVEDVELTKHFTAAERAERETAAAPATRQRLRVIDAMKAPDNREAVAAAVEMMEERNPGAQIRRYLAYTSADPISVERAAAIVACWAGRSMNRQGISSTYAHNPDEAPDMQKQERAANAANSASTYAATRADRISRAANRYKWEVAQAATAADNGHAATAAEYMQAAAQVLSDCPDLADIVSSAKVGLLESAKEHCKVWDCYLYAYRATLRWIKANRAAKAVNATPGADITFTADGTPCYNMPHAAESRGIRVAIVPDANRRPVMRVSTTDTATAAEKAAAAIVATLSDERIYKLSAYIAANGNAADAADMSGIPSNSIRYIVRHTLPNMARRQYPDIAPETRADSRRKVTAADRVAEHAAMLYRFKRYKEQPEPPESYSFPPSPYKLELVTTTPDGTRKNAD